MSTFTFSCSFCAWFFSFFYVRVTVLFTLRNTKKRKKLEYGSHATSTIITRWSHDGAYPCHIIHIVVIKNTFWGIARGNEVAGATSSHRLQTSERPKAPPRITLMPARPLLPPGRWSTHTPTVCAGASHNPARRPTLSAAFTPAAHLSDNDDPIYGIIY